MVEWYGNRRLESGCWQDKGHEIVVMGRLTTRENIDAVFAEKNLEAILSNV